MGNSLPPSLSFSESDAFIIELIRKETKKKQYHSDPILRQQYGYKRSAIPGRMTEEQKEKIRLRTREYDNNRKKAIFVILGDECCWCTFNDPRALQIDHVHGGGVKEIKEVKGNYYKFILDQLNEGTDKYQLLCANCNWIKRHENKEY